MMWIRLQITILFIFLCAYAHAFNSQAEWQTYKQTNQMSVCFDQGFEKILWDKSAWCNITLPDVFADDTAISPNPVFPSDASVSCDPNIAVGTQVAQALMSLGAVGAITEILRFVNICTNGYVFAPYEIANNIAQQYNITYNNQLCTFNEYDVPYIFHCNPGWTPMTVTTSTTNGVTTVLSNSFPQGGAQVNVLDPSFGRTPGFTSPTLPYCRNPCMKAMMNNQGANGALQQALYAVSFAVDGQYYFGVSPPDPPLHAGDHDTTGDFFRAYYNLDGDTGKLMLCVSTEDLGGFSGIQNIGEVILGCTPIAPIPDTLFDCDDMYSDTRFSAFCQLQGRCYYLGTSRLDLNGLAQPGTDLADTYNATSVSGPDGQYVKNFLLSDFHITSVVVGCIQDLLLGLFSGPVNMFQQFQINMNGMVLATLTLYLAYVALKTLMRASNPLSRGEFVMYIVKFALVYAFAAGGAWYNSLPGGGPGSPSLIASILEIPNTMANWFLTAQNVNDPINYCQLTYEGQNILSERDVPTPINGFPTNGFPGIVKLSVWDLVDCKLANYLTFASCDFSVGGLMPIWLIVALLTSMPFPFGVALAIIMMIYVVMVFYTVFRIAQIFILSLFAITILVFISPIFLLFWLFDYTKGIFEGWAAMLLGYILYPALLFAFLALMLATFDSVFYGFAGPVNAISDFSTNCARTDSIFCTLYTVIGQQTSTANLNFCDLPFGSLVGALLSPFTIPFIGTFYTVDASVINQFLTPMVKIMLFAALFKFFMNTMIGTMAAVLGVIDLQQYAKGANVIKDVVKIATKVVQTAKSGKGK